MFPSESSLIKTCSTGFPDISSHRNSSAAKKTKYPISRAKSGEVLSQRKPKNQGSNKITSQKQPRPPFKTEQFSPGFIEQDEIKEEEEEEENEPVPEPQSTKKEESKNENVPNASLGIGYFFEEGQVPAEVEDLMLKYQDYAYGIFYYVRYNFVRAGGKCCKYERYSNLLTF